MPTSFPESIIERIRRAGIIATLTIDDPDDAVPLARALSAGGIDILELTLRTSTAPEALRRICADVPEVIVGAGTILTPLQARECVDAGAAFGVAPGMNRNVVTEAQRIGLPFAPGVCTPTDIEQSLECGCRLMKFFPSEPIGGLAYLRSVAAPYRHLGVEFIPLGGIDLRNAAAYISEDFIPALGGSWLAPRDLVNRKDWRAITANAEEAVDLIERIRSPKI